MFLLQKGATVSQQEIRYFWHTALCELGKWRCVWRFRNVTPSPKSTQPDRAPSTPPRPVTFQVYSYNLALTSCLRAPHTQSLSGHFFLSRFQLCPTNLKTGPIKILPCPIMSFHLRSLPAPLIYVAFFGILYISHIQQSKEMFSNDMLKKWNASQACSSASHITIPVFRVFLILQLGASFDSPLFQMHIHTHHIWL